MKKRLIVGITGSSGVIMGIRLLEVLQGGEIETHLVLSPSARMTIEQETAWKPADVQALADYSYGFHDVGAAIASGSFVTAGMVVIPCSIKTLSAVANSYTGDLLSRAADVTLKEGRPLLLAVRETPLHRGHIRLLDRAAAAGAIIFPPAPAFYTHPQSVDEIVDNLVGRALLRLGIENNLFKTWEGPEARPAAGSQPPEGIMPPAANPLPAGDGLTAELLALPAMTLATTGPDGAPHAAAVYFVAGADSSLYFFSEPGSQHALDLAFNPRAAVTIQPVASDYQEIRGLQGRGTARLVPPGAEWDGAFALYQAKFPFVERMKAEIAKNTLYVFKPTWQRLLDNRRGFGYKEEKNLP